MIMNVKIVLPLLAVIVAAASAAMTGGAADADLEDQGVKDALQWAVGEHNKNTNDAYVSQVARVIKAKTQVVAGIKYIFTVEMARTSCRKGGADDQLCSIPEAAQTHKCTFEVWSRPWLGSTQLVKNTC